MKPMTRRPTTEAEVEDYQARARDFSHQRRYTEALEICDWLIDDPATRLAGLRQRAAVKELQGDLRAAINDLSAVIETFAMEPADFHSLGLLQLEAGDTREAIISLSRAIETGDAAGSTYYRNSSLFFRAFARLKIDELAAATKDCELLPAGYQTHISGEGIVSREALLDQAKRRAHHGS